MELFFGIIVGLIILVTLVVLHELGHAIVAYRNGVVVEEFGIGFPPRAWSKKLKNKIVFSLNWLPIGGFVKLKGEYDSANKKGDYGAATFWQKTKILLAGVTINWLTAVVLLTILAWTGLPSVLPDQFTIPSDARITTHPIQVVVQKGSPAEKAGLKTDDEVRQFAGKTITQAGDLTTLAKTNKGKTVDVTYVRGGKQSHTTVTLRSEVKAGEGYLGVSTSGEPSTIHTTWSAPIVGFGTTVQLTGATFDGLGKLVGNVGGGIAAQFSSDTAVKKAGNEGLASAKEGVFGPVGIFGTLFPSATAGGPTKLILLTAIISLSLAVMNVLPIPALDGGRWFTMVIFRLLKKPLTKEREEKIQTVGFLTLMALIVLVTVVDVSKIIK
jgi:regulator of sigma E protease